MLLLGDVAAFFSSPVFSVLGSAVLPLVLLLVVSGLLFCFSRLVLGVDVCVSFSFSSICWDLDVLRRSLDSNG